MRTIDLRSDTVSQPTAAMRAAMSAAPVGDDVYGEDPTVNRLQATAAEILGKEAALFTPSGTQSNLLAVMSHCQRGDEYIVGQEAHTYKFEGGGAAVLGSVQPQPLDFEPDGTLDLGKAALKIKPPDVHFARTRLLCLENTHNSKVLPMDYLETVPGFASEHRLGTHLDGARLFNAAVKLGCGADAIAQYFDTVSFCLSKGLGAPVGSLLCGNKALIERAHRWRKVLGGGMRQAGILAAAGLHALAHHVERLAEDHANAAALAEGLAGIDELIIDRAALQTNMVFVAIDPPQRAADLQRYLKTHGILISGRTGFRLVTHIDVSRADIDRMLAATKDFFAQ